MIALAFIWPLAAHSYVGLFTQYMADDYCQASGAGQGVWASQVALYRTWQGTVASNLLALLSGRLPPESVRFWPAAALTLWVVLLTWTIWLCRPTVRRLERWLISVVLAAAVMALTLDGRPQMTPQVVYWLNGSLRYLGAQLFLASYVGYVVFAQRLGSETPRWGVSLIAAGLAAIAGLFSEAHTAAQITGLGLAVAAFVVVVTPERRRNTLPLLVAGLCGSVAALLVILWSPGMRVRQSLFAEPPGLVTTGVRALGYTLEFLGDLVARAPETIAVAIVVPALLARWGGAESADRHPRPLGRRDLAPWLIGLPVGCVVVLTACFATAAWAVSAFPPTRTLLIPRFALFTGLMAWGFLAGRWLRADADGGGRARPVGLPGLLSLVLVTMWPIGEGLRAVAVRAEAEAHARTWSAFDRQLRDAAATGLAAVHLPAPGNVAGLDVVGPDRAFWVNGCVSGYYGVSVTGFPPPPIPTEAERRDLTPVDVDIGGVASITGYALHQTYATGGESLDLTVEWRPQASTEVPHAVYFGLHDASDEPFVQQLVASDLSGYVSSTWVPGRPFLARYRFEVPPETDPRPDARLVVGLSPGSASERLPFIGTAGADGSLGPIRMSQSGCGPREEGRDVTRRQRDAALQTELAGGFARDPLLDGRHIELAVYDAVVTLCSDDTNASERERARQLATQGDGVADVVDLMR